MRHVALNLTLFLCCMQIGVHALADGKLIATPGVTQFEGTGGTGIVPWAMLSSYASRDQLAASAFGTHLSTQDLNLSAAGIAVNLFDRLELSAARQKLDVDSANSLPAISVSQDVFGAKLRLFGDIAYSAGPQVSLGAQNKRLKDDVLALAAGAAKTEHTDIYVAVSKLHFAAVANYNLLWNVTGRWTAANQTGFLGFGSAGQADREFMLEGSVALLLGRHWLVGIDVRRKPDNLAFAEEAHWQDVFVAYVPNKHVSVTAAWTDLGDVAGLGSQSGFYLSLTGFVH